MPTVLLPANTLREPDRLRKRGELDIKARFVDNVLNLFRAKFIGLDLQQELRVIQVQVPLFNGFILLQFIQWRLNPVHTLDAIDIRLEEIRTHTPSFAVPPPLLCRGEGIREWGPGREGTRIIMMVIMDADILTAYLIPPNPYNLPMPIPIGTPFRHFLPKAEDLGNIDP